MLLSQSLDEARGGHFQPLLLPSKLLFERFQADPLPLNLFLPFPQRDEDLVVALRDRVEELEGVLEVRERAGTEHRVEPDRTFPHVRLGGSSVQQFLSRLDLS
jgi:hypothetical protein